MEKKKITKLFLKISVSLTLAYILVQSLDIPVFLSQLKAMNLVYLPIVTLLIVLNYIFSSLRWKQLLIFDNTSHVSVPYLIRLYFIGSFFNNFMPTSIGGDVYKIFRLGKKIKNNAHAVAATFTERFLGVLVLIAFSVFGFIIHYGYIGLVFFVTGCLVALILFKYTSKYLWKIKFIAQVLEALTAYSRTPNIIKIGIITSVLVQLIAIFTQYFIFVALGYSPPLVFSFLVLPLITLASFFIPSLNGIGVQDTLYVSLFAQVGIPAEVSLASSISYHFMRLVVSLIGGIFYVTENTE